MFASSELKKHFPRLYCFARTPPGLKLMGSAIPHSEDYSKSSESLAPASKALYGNKKFLHTIPAEYLVKWKRTGQLTAIFDQITGLDWWNYSVEKWKIRTRNISLEQALIRETYFSSPRALGFRGPDLSKEQKERYGQAHIAVLNSTILLAQYRFNFINPEILLPFKVDISDMFLKSVESID